MEAILGFKVFYLTKDATFRIKELETFQIQEGKLSIFDLKEQLTIT